MIDAALRLRFGSALGPRIGGGGEANVYALGDDRVVRLCNQDASRLAFGARSGLLGQLNGRCGGVAVPRVLEEGHLEGHFYTIETRIPGEPMDKSLANACNRTALLTDYMETASQLSSGSVTGPYGEVAHEQPITSPSLKSYMASRARVSMKQGGVRLDADQLAAPFAEPEKPALVHLDYFPGNVMTDGERVTGVLDFGYSTIVGDARFTPVLAAIYLSNRITPPARDEDRVFAMSWLEEQGLAELVDPLRRWIAAYWSFCRKDDPNLAAEIRRVLDV